MEFVYRAVLTATVVAMVLMASRLRGGRIAGLLAGAPLVTAPALTWIAIDRGAEAAREAGIGSVASCVVVVGFALAYDRAARRFRPAPTALIATVALLLLSWPAYHWLGDSVAAALVASLVACGAALLALPAAPDAGALAVFAERRTRVAATAVLAGGISGVIAFFGPGLDPWVAGSLASLPLVGAAGAIAEHARGSGHATRFWRGYVEGLVAKAGFGACFAWLVTVSPPVFALLAAAAAALSTALVSERWLRLRRFRITRSTGLLAS